MEDEATLKRFGQKNEREVDLLPESTNQAHRPMTIDLGTAEFHMDGENVGALTDDGQSRS